MANRGRRMTAYAQSPLALARSSLSKLAKRFHSGPGDKFRVKILKRELVHLSDPARRLEPRDEVSLLTIHPKTGSAPLVVATEDPLVVEPTGYVPKAPHKLPIMVVRQMGEECTSICDANEPRETSASLNHSENYLAFAITYILSSILQSGEKSLPAVQKVVASNIQHLDFSQLSSQPPPHQCPLSPFGGGPLYLPDGNNGCGGGYGELPGGLPGGCGSNHPDDDDSSHGAGEGSNGEGGDGSQGKGKGADTNGPQFACPFFRHDPFLYEKCLKFKLSRYSDVKQHIRRYHMVEAYYCRSCMQQWKTHCPEYVAHLAAGCTKASAHKYLDKEEVETIIGTSRARGRTGTDNWMGMWHRLFPEDDKPVSPFLDTYFAEMTNACRDRNRLEIGEKLKSWIAAGGEPTEEKMSEMVTEIQDLCLNTAPAESRLSPRPNHVYAKSTGSLSIQVQESRPRNHSDPGPSSLVVPCENHAPATAPLMYSQGSNEQYLSVPPREYRPSRNSMSALPSHAQPMATQEQPFLGPRSSSFGGFTTTHFSATQNDMFNAASGLQYNEAGSNLFLEYPTMANPWGIEESLGAAQGLGSVAGRVQLDFEPSYLQDIPPHIDPLLGADSGMINPSELGSIGTGNTPHLVDVPSPSSSARSIQLVQPKRKASKSADAKQPTAKRGPTRYSG